MLLSEDHVLPNGNVGMISRWAMDIGGTFVMKGTELRRRLNRFARPYTELAPLLGLSIDGLHKQMRGDRHVTRQTEIILERLEADRAAPRQGACTARKI
jgi:hypothetical protein